MADVTNQLATYIEVKVNVVERTRRPVPTITSRNRPRSLMFTTSPQFHPTYCNDNSV